MRYLEVIALNKEDVNELNNTNIDRIELCVDIKNDGLTPSEEIIEEALKISNKEINVMIRNSNTFFLEENEKNEMLKTIKYLSSLQNIYSNLSGIVLGYITQDNNLNEQFLEEVNSIRGNLKVTFHKASDFLFNNQDILKLKKYKIDTVLTQGGKDSIDNNFDSILWLKENLGNDIEILLGGGISADNIENILPLNTSIHIGSLARIDNSYNKGYNISYINEIKEKMKDSDE